MRLEAQLACKNLQKINKEQLKRFAKKLRSCLIDKGAEKTLVDSCLKTAIQEMNQDRFFEKQCQLAMSSACDKSTLKGNRGIDSIGRILVEYCFIRVPEKKMVWPESSKVDQRARETFVQGVIPRPLLTYFLVSIRGAIPELNNFKADSVLFGKENKQHEERKEYVDALVRKFDGPEADNRTKWESIYRNERFQTIARSLIGETRRKIEEFGLERYLRILENFRQRDPDSKTKNKMQRPFTLDDIKQIETALWAAEEALAKPLD